MSDLVRIRITEWYCAPQNGTTTDKSHAHLYERHEAERLQRKATVPVELEPVAPTPDCRCAELAAALEKVQGILQEAPEITSSDCDADEIDGLNDACIQAWKIAAEHGKSAATILAAHDAAKDAEIARLRKALEDVECVLDPKNNPELEPWRRAELAGQYAKAALEGGRA